MGRADQLGPSPPENEEALLTEPWTAKGEQGNDTKENPLMSIPSLGDTPIPDAHRAALVADLVPLAGWSAALRQGREDRGHSRSSLARSFEAAQSYISSLENGEPEWVKPVALRLLRACGWEPVLAPRWVDGLACIPGDPKGAADGDGVEHSSLTLLTEYDPSRVGDLGLDDGFEASAELAGALVDIGAGRFSEAAFRLDELAATAARAARRCRIAASEAQR